VHWVCCFPLDPWSVCVVRDVCGVFVFVRSVMCVVCGVWSVECVVLCCVVLSGFLL
jgi:hypothetical protein